MATHRYERLMKQMFSIQKTSDYFSDSTLSGVSLAIFMLPPRTGKNVPTCIQHKILEHKGKQTEFSQKRRLKLSVEGSEAL